MASISTTSTDVEMLSDELTIGDVEVGQTLDFEQAFSFDVKLEGVKECAKVMLLTHFLVVQKNKLMLIISALPFCIDITKKKENLS